MAKAKVVHLVIDEHEPGTSVRSAAASGDRLELLVAMRARIAEAVDEASTPARDLAALTRRLLEIAKEVDVLQAAERQEGDGDGEANDEPFDPATI